MKNHFSQFVAEATGVYKRQTFYGDFPIPYSLDLLSLNNG